MKFSAQATGLLSGMALLTAGIGAGTGCTSTCEDPQRPAPQQAIHQQIPGENGAAQSDIFLKPIDGGEPIQVTATPESESDAAISPDGTKIAFVSDAGGDSEIWVMNLDGTERTQLTSNRSEDIEPVWSEDGTEIHFTSNGSGAWKRASVEAKRESSK